MKIVIASGTLGLAVMTVLAGPFAMADDTGWYAGANIGQSRAKIDDEKINSGLLGNGFTSSVINDDNRDLGYKLFGGYQFNSHFAVEAGYFDLGKFSFRANTQPAGVLDGAIKLKGVNVDAVGTLPLTDRFSAFGRVGVSYAQARDSFSGSGSVTVLNPNPSKRQANYKFGAGLQYDFTPSLAMRVEAERYRINDAVGNKGDIDLISTGLLYRFGQKTPTPAPREAPPEQVAAVPAPVVVPTEPPPPPRPAPAPRRVSFSTDSLFDFGKATVKPSGKQALDKFAADLRGADFDVITITGHTDRIGSHDYNMKLSTRRAEAVKSYLVESAGFPADKIAAKGVDGADPVTKPGDCKGRTANRKLIACLQPDRRVDVEVSGTR